LDNNYNIALYVRLSSEDVDLNKNGKEESNSIKNQKDLLNNFVKSKSEFDGAVIHTMVDDGFSGTNFQRPAISELLELTRQNEINCIIVKDFSRFGRNYLEVSDYVDQIFPFMGVRFISVNDNYDSANMDGKTSGLEVAFKNIIYSYYSKDLSQKVKSAKLTKALKGDYLSPYAPFGYEKAQGNKNQLIVEPLSAEIVKRIFNMACAGISATEIAKIFNAEQVEERSVYKNKTGVHYPWHIINKTVKWQNNIICSILRDERYLGKVVYGKRYRPEVGNKMTKKKSKSEWVVVENRHEPLVSFETFQKAQSVMKKYAEKEFEGRKIYLFTGKLKCGVCGHPLRRRSKNCAMYYCFSTYADESSKCMREPIAEADIARAVLQAIQLYIMIFIEKEQLRKKSKERNQMLELEKQIAVYEGAALKCKNQKMDCYDKYANEEITRQQYILQCEKIHVRQKQFQQLINTLTEKIIGEKKLKAERKVLPQDNLLRQYLEVDTLTREMVVTFVDSIYVYADNSIHIQWKFDEFRQNT
jgi:Site-specific recombinases, DNA invertase Pin homologs